MIPERSASPEDRFEMFEDQPTQAYCFRCAEVLQMRTEGGEHFLACPGCGKRLD